MIIDNTIEGSIKEYAIAIEQLALNKSAMYFSNSGIDHAAIVMSNIFKTSEKKVRIFSGRLSGVVCDKEEYTHWLSRFLYNNGELDLLLEEKPDPESKSLEKIKYFKSLTPGKVRIKLLGEVAQEKLSKKSQKFHFMVGDDRMFRFEHNTQNYTAVCSFNDIQTSKQLATLFDSFFVGAKDLE